MGRRQFKACPVLTPSSWQIAKFRLQVLDLVEVLMFLEVYNVALCSFFWSSTKCLIHPGLDHLLQEMLGAVQVFHSQVVIAKGETLLVRNLSNDVK